MYCTDVSVKIPITGNEITNGVKGIIAPNESHPHPILQQPDPGACANHLKETKNKISSPVSCHSLCMLCVSNT